MVISGGPGFLMLRASSLWLQSLATRTAASANSAIRRKASINQFYGAANSAEIVRSFSCACRTLLLSCGHSSMLGPVLPWLKTFATFVCCASPRILLPSNPRSLASPHSWLRPWHPRPASAPGSFCSGSLLCRLSTLCKRKCPRRTAHWSCRI